MPWKFFCWIFNLKILSVKRITFIHLLSPQQLHMMMSISLFHKDILTIIYWTSLKTNVSGAETQQRTKTNKISANSKSPPPFLSGVRSSCKCKTVPEATLACNYCKHGKGRQGKHNFRSFDLVQRNQGCFTNSVIQ